MASIKVDAHVHVWSPAFPTHPDHPLPASLSATDTDLLRHMDNAGIDKTVIVQPINYKFNHSCVSDAISRHPSRFTGVALADTTLKPAEACNALDEVVQRGFRGVRINPTFTESGFADESVRALVEKAGELGVPVALFARPEHLDDVAKLLSENQETKLVLDHFAFCTPRDHYDSQRKVLELGARSQNLYVKTSAWFRASNESWPHRDLHTFMSELISTFGANRLLVGSDYPFVKEKYDYSRAFSLFDHIDLNAEDRAWILGKTAAKLYNL